MKCPSPPKAGNELVLRVSMGDGPTGNTRGDLPSGP